MICWLLLSFVAVVAVAGAKKQMIRALTCLVPCLVLFLTSCGYKEVEKKEFRLYLDTRDGDILRETRKMFAHYNSRVGGGQALHLAATADDANSTITWTPGLQARDGKLGYGQ